MSDFITIDDILLFFPNDEEDKAFLQLQLNACLQEIKQQTGCNLELQTTYEILSCNSSTPQLEQKPVQEVLKVSGAVEALLIESTVVRPMVKVDSTALTLNGTVIDYATYPTIQQIADKINTLTGCTATVSTGQGAYPGTDLKHCFNQPAKKVMVRAFTDDKEYVFREDPATIVLTFTPAFDTIQAVYTNGWACCPDNIKRAIAIFVQYSYNMRSVNLAMQSESLGGYSYNLAAKRGWMDLDPLVRGTILGLKKKRIRGMHIS